MKKILLSLALITLFISSPFIAQALTTVQWNDRLSTGLITPVIVNGNIQRAVVGGTLLRPAVFNVGTTTGLSPSINLEGNNGYITWGPTALSYYNGQIAGDGAGGLEMATGDGDLVFIPGGLQGIVNRNFTVKNVAGNPTFKVLSNGNVGIGTTTPGTTLSIGNTGANTINLSETSTSTFGKGINLRGGCYAINGTCLSGSGSMAIGGTVTSGSAGSVLFINPSNTLAQDNGNFYYDAAQPALYLNQQDTTPTNHNAVLDINAGERKYGSYILSSAVDWGDELIGSYISTTQESFNGSGVEAAYGTKIQVTNQDNGNQTEKAYGVYVDVTDIGSLESSYGGYFLNNHSNNGNEGVGVVGNAPTGTGVEGLGDQAGYFVGTNIGLQATGVSIGGAFFGNSSSSGFGALYASQVNSAGKGIVQVGGAINSFAATRSGFGSTTPGTALSIGTTGGINFSPTATSTFGSSANGINIKNGCYAINGTCISGSGGGGSGTVLTGVAGQMPYYAANGTTLTATSTITIGTTTTNNGNVGIGTTTVDSAKLTLTSNSITNPAFLVNGVAGLGGVGNDSAGIGFYLTNNATGNRQFVIADSATNIGVRYLNSGVDGFNNGSRADLKVGTETNGFFTGFQTSNSFVSISNRSGSIQSKAVLDVQGASVSSDGTAQTGPLIASELFGETQGQRFLVNGNGRVGIGTTSPWANLSVSTSTQSSGNPALFAVASSTNATLFNVMSNGNVGVATTTPYANLSVEMTTNDPSFVVGNNGSTTPSLYVGGVNQNGNIGINTATPRAPLSLGNALTTQKFLVYDSSTDKYGFGVQSGEMQIYGPSSSGGKVTFGGLNGTTGVFTTAATLDTNNGWFGVGAVPTMPFESLGSGALAATASIGTSNVTNFGRAVNGGTSWPQAATFAVGRWNSTPTNFSPNTRLDLLLKNNSDGNAYGDTTVMTWQGNGNVGIGTTTPTSILSVSTTTSSGLTALFTLASSTNATVFSVNGSGHIKTGGSTPTVSSCGTSPTISGNDTAGTVTVGSGVVTACTITFAAPRSGTPRVVGVVVGGGLSITGGYSAKSNTAVTFSFAATVASGTFDYLIVE